VHIEDSEMKEKEVRGKIKAVIFDIGSVLVLSKQTLKVINGKRYYLGVHESIARKLGISLDQWLDTLEFPYSKSYVGKISEAQTVSVISKNLNCNPPKLKKVIVETYKENFKQNTELYKFAFKLKKQGYKIAILSDQWQLSKEAVVDPKLMAKFNLVIISCDVGLRKPDLPIYKLTLKKLGLKPQECVFIDNQTWNLTPAKKLGMEAILFKTNKQVFKQLFKIGVKV